MENAETAKTMALIAVVVMTSPVWIPFYFVFIAPLLFVWSIIHQVTGLQLIIEY